MITWLEQFLVRYPELALFLVIAAGYWIGSFKIGAFSLGPVTGALFAGLFVGQFAHVPVSGMTKSFLFLLFLFGIGYSVGPQFMQSLKRDGLKPMLLAVVVCITGLAASILVAKVLRLDPGFAAGLMSGALTQSAAMGTATDAINGLALPEADRALLVAHIAVADAVCYIFGYAGVIIFCTVIAPVLLKIDLRTEALKLEQALGMTRAKPGLASAWRKFELRAYRLAEESPLAGLTVAAAEARVPDHRLFIHRLRRGERILEAEPGTTLEAGDVIALSGPREFIVEQIGPRAEEVEDKELLDVPVTSRRCSPDEFEACRHEARGRVEGGLGARSLLAMGAPRQSGDPRCGRRRAAARRFASHRRPRTRRREGGGEDRRHCRSQHKYRFRRVGTCDFPRRRHWRSRDLFRRKRQNLAEHERRHAARWTSGWSSPHPLSAVRANSRGRHHLYDVAGAGGFRRAHRDPCGADLPLGFEGGRASGSCSAAWW